MAEKVKVSREVASELVKVKSRALTVHEIAVADSEDCLNRFGNLTFDELIRALYIGYEIEQTPEEKLLAYYLDLEFQYTSTGQKVNTGYAPGREYVEKTLEILGIKIKGIND